MNIAEYAVKKRTFTVFATVLLAAAGVWSYFGLGRLEDPEFTVKTAVVITYYPGASALQVEQLVTDPIEAAARKLKELKHTKSYSRPGCSVVYVQILDEVRSPAVPQVWDRLRKRLGDVRLPEGAWEPILVDDFGDVYGVLYALTADGFTREELNRFARFFEKELSLVEGVGRVTIWGMRREVVYVEISASKLAALGIPPAAVVQVLQDRCSVADAGSADLDRERFRVEPGGEFESVEEIGNLTVKSAGGGLFRLRDVARIERGFLEPPERIMRFNGKPAVAIGVSVKKNGNVMLMGEAVKRRVAELLQLCPAGVQMHLVAYQPDDVAKAVDTFVVNLVEAVLIVLITLFVAMGFRSGLLIGGGLVVTILGTFVVMRLGGINLQRVSLGALIIALGMLVDNAIVVTDLMLVKLKRGADRLTAAREAVAESAMPLLGATVIAILAFLAIYISKHATGEFCASLFYVVAISLLLSWFLAVTVTPMLNFLFLKGEAEPGRDPHGGPAYRMYAGFLRFALRHRAVVLLVMFALLAAAVQGFGLVKKSFFPPSTRTELLVDYWLPEGSSITSVSADLRRLERMFDPARDPRVKSITTFVGSGPPRFYLPMEPEFPQPHYGFMLVRATSEDVRDELLADLRWTLAQAFPHAEARARKQALGVPTRFKIEARFTGPERETLRELAERAKEILRSRPESYLVTDDWRGKVKVVEPVLDEAQAARLGLSRAEMAFSLRRALEGVPVAVLREADLQMPVLVRAPAPERSDLPDLPAAPVFSARTMTRVPLAALTRGLRVRFEDGVIARRDGRRTVTVACDVRGIQASTFRDMVKEKIEAMPLPPGYTVEWGGEYEGSKESRDAIMAGVPVSGLLMLLVLVALFNALRQPLIIALTVPLASIGVTAGLLATDQPFGFMALLGAISLSGMVIKNSIVLIDKTDSVLAGGGDRFEGVVSAAVSRFRPVLMAALTTVLGMLPLYGDPFFRSMATTIMFGLTFATVLTLVVVPVFYSVLFGIRPSRSRSV